VPPTCRRLPHVYICSTRRRKPGLCTNTLALPTRDTDDAVLDVVEGQVLGTRFIEELLTVVDDGTQQGVAHLEADRDRLQKEISKLMDLAASGIPVRALPRRYASGRPRWHASRPSFASATGTAEY
jgi:hypothetical protein